MKKVSTLLIIFILISCSTEKVDPAYEEEVLNFRKKRIDYLKSRKGYLNLVGLYWLENGEYKIGSNQNNDIVFPKGFPPQFGAFIHSGDTFHFQFNEPVMVDSTHQVSIFSFNAESIDHHFSWESFQFFIIKRGALYALRIKDFENPVLHTDFKIPSYPVNPNWRIKAQFQFYEETNKRTISNIYGHDVIQPTAGTVSFSHQGKHVELEANIEGGKVAVIFMDETTGGETYKGGRQLYVTDPDENGNVMLDFNQAFNFPCAFNDFTTCPVPPERNRMPFPIRAGEKSYSKNISSFIESLNNP